MHSLHTGRVGAKVFELYGWNYQIRPEGAGAHISSTPCFTLIEQALSAFLTLIMFNEPWILPDEICVIVFTFFYEGEYDP